eukprot:UN31197
MKQKDRIEGELKISEEARKSRELYEKIKTQYTDSQMVNKGGCWRMSTTQAVSSAVEIVGTLGITLGFRWYCDYVSGLKPDVEEG